MGQRSDTLSSKKLPSKRDVMSLFYHYKDINKQTVREASHSTAKDVFKCGNKRIFQRDLRSMSLKNEGLFKDYDKLKKNKENKAKRSEALKMEGEWKTSLDDLFDIAHAQAMEQISIEEDQQFLTA